MAATISNAIKAFLESRRVGAAAYRDSAPFDEQHPFITITEAIAFTPDGAGDGGRGETGVEMIQVDVWEDWKDDDGVVIESDLALTVSRILHGAMLETAPTRVYGVSFVSRRRLLEPESNTVHNAITANVRRAL